MKLANAKIEYPGGTIITDRVSLDVRTGEVLVPPRLRRASARSSATSRVSTASRATSVVRHLRKPTSPLGHVCFLH
jgi:hypothetical protein